MGGPGSGRRFGLGLLVDKCHEYHSIDIAWLRRNGMLSPGLQSTIRWRRAENETGSIRIVCQPQGLRLVYRQRVDGGAWQDIDEQVPIVETATRFGGRRQWFLCLSCGRRCRIIYGGALFRCRSCHALRYDTQYEPAFARAATRALKIRQRLSDDDGIDNPIPARPKGMHRATYGKLVAEYERMTAIWWGGIAERAPELLP